jgi:aconitase B
VEILVYSIGYIMTIKDKAQKVVTKVDEVIAIADPVSDRLLDLIKNSKRTVLIIILIVGLIIWMV